MAAKAVLASGPFPVTHQPIEKITVSNHTLGSIFLLGFALRVLLMFVAGNNGGDAFVRYEIGVTWLHNPWHLPSLVYLPLHPILNGLAYAVWPSEMGPRFFTVVLGSLTVLLFGGIAQRLFSPLVTVFSTLMFALFGFHIAYSMTTSAEVPTLFFLALGMYGWVRYVKEDRSAWLWVVLLGFGCAAWCKLEAWVFMAPLAVFTLDWSGGLKSAIHNKKRWRMAALFGIASTAGAISLMSLAYVWWHDPIAFAHRSFAIGNQLPGFLRQSPLYSSMAHPGALFMTLSPVVMLLSVLGITLLFRERGWLWKVPGALAVFSLAVWTYMTIYHSTTMARYTLLYSWLLIPYAFTAIEWLSKGSVRRARDWMMIVIATAVLWQGATLAGAYYAPAAIANKLSSVAITLPMRPDIRAVAAWMHANVNSGEYLAADNFNEEAADVVRLCGLDRSQAMILPWLTPSERGGDADQRLRSFVIRQHPSFLIYSPKGRLHALWGMHDETDFEVAGLGVSLHRVFANGNYRVYRMSYGPTDLRLSSMLR